MARVITLIYQEIFQKPYNSTNPSDIATIHNMAYLLERLGLDFCETFYLWDKNGPHSLGIQALINSELINDSPPAELSKYAKELVESVKQIIHEGADCGLGPSQWMELVCTLHFLKNYCVDNGPLTSELKRLKPQFSDDAANNKALSIVDEIDTLGYYDTRKDNV